MSKYTITFKELIDGGYYTESEIKEAFTSYELSDYLTDEEISKITNRGTWSKEKLANKIFNHYYMEEIGFQTFERFKHEAKVLMSEIMEQKLPQIYSLSLKYDPLVNVDYSEEFIRNLDVTSQSINQSNINADGIVLNSDTPQGRTTKNEILSGNYVSSTSGNETTTTENDTSNGVSNTDENYIKKIKGNSGVSATAQALLKQYRDYIITVDKDIIKEVNILFMGLF